MRSMPEVIMYLIVKLMICILGEDVGWSKNLKKKYIPVIASVPMLIPASVISDIA